MQVWKRQPAIKSYDAVTLTKHAAARRSERNDTGKDEEFDHVFHSSIFNTIHASTQNNNRWQGISIFK